MPHEAQGESPGDRTPQPSLPDKLNALLRERWSFCTDRIVYQPGASDAIPLTGPDARQALVARFEQYCRSMPGEDRRGLGSLWAQWYAVTVWPPLVTGILLRGAAPRLDAAETALLVDDDGCPVGLRVAPGTRSGDPATLLDTLAREHADPLLTVIAEATATAPRVPWSNVANVVGWMLGELGAIADTTALAPGYALLARRRLADGRPNPLYTGADCVPATGRPPRRVCCLRYRLSGFGYCGDCPIPECGRASNDAS